MTAVDLLGYVASILVAFSLTRKSILRMRIVSLIAASCFSVYGFMLKSVPIAGLNVLIVFINLYFIWQMLTQKTFFKLLEVDRTSSYLKSFLEFYQNDIARYFPNFHYDVTRADMVYLTLRNLQPVGLFITERDATGRAVVKLDYVIPGYRDLKAGQFLYEQLAQQLPARGIKTLYSVPGSDEHHHYLKRMGFRPQGDMEKVKLYARDLGGK